MTKLNKDGTYAVIYRGDYEGSVDKNISPENLRPELWAQGNLKRRLGEAFHAEVAVTEEELIQALEAK